MLSYVARRESSSQFRIGLPFILPHLTPLQWICTALAALCIGMSKSGLSGISLATILLMARVFPPRESTGIILPMLIAADFLACRAFRLHAQWRHVWRLLPATVVGVVLGYFAMRAIPEGNYRQLIGWIILVMALLQGLKMRYRELPLPALHRAPFAITMGVTTGVTTMLANAAGPVAALYMTAVDLPKMQFIATSAFLFLIVNLIKVPFSASQGLITADTLLFNATCIPFIAIGVFGGRWIIHRLSQRVFETWVLVFSIAAALRLIWI
ncbi:MAG: sulfite exporter TauE/SafE family protein [Chthoniobacterales bacterium]